MPLPCIGGMHGCLKENNVRTLYHSGSCPGHMLAPGEPSPPLSQCQQYPDTVEHYERRDPRFNRLWREVREADRERR
jgi:hypothetical protein